MCRVQGILLFLAIVGNFISASYCEASCKAQQTYISKLALDKDPVKSKFVTEYVFTNTSKPSLLLTWAGENKKVLIVAMLEASFPSKPSELYRSDNDGRSFERISDKLNATEPLIVQSANGLQRNPINPSILYVVSHSLHASIKSYLFVSKDDGVTWSKVPLGFYLSGSIVFHHTDPNYLLVHDHNVVHGSSDGGLTWKVLSKNVYKVSWAEAEDKEPRSIYIVQDKSLSVTVGFSLFSQRQRINKRKLMKSSDFGASWRIVMSDIVSFKALKNFIYVSKSDPKTSTRHLRVSTDSGTTFHMAHLPAISTNRFYSVLDVADGLVLVHVDNGYTKGHGTLYTSDASGRFFSKSLERHLYPPFGYGTDLYRVQSMRGTYLATTMHDDDSMHSVITHNRGAEWKSLPKPEGATCADKSRPCHLQLASTYSIHRGVTAQPPISISGAVGVIIGHGHAAAALQSGSTDVFVSNDGGFSWAKALAGPHLVQVANQGGLIVAMEMKLSSNVVKFSTDEGRCWHSYQFTEGNYSITGLLTEPGNRATSVAIWGFNKATKHWRLFVLDFDQVLRRQCNSSDYEAWLSHGQLNYGQRDWACVMGSKVTYMRLKADSVCANSYNWQSEAKLDKCTCTKNDYECEYGYSRAINSLECVKDGNVPEVDICDDNVMKRIITDGYRKLPGNQCSGGFKPNSTTQRVVLHNRHCAQPTPPPEVQRGQQFIQQLQHRDQAAKQQADDAKLRTTVAVIVPLFITFVVLMAIVLSVIILARMREQRRRQLAFHYSTVSALGRRSDAAGAGGAAGAQYRPNDAIINPNLPTAPSYSATAAAAAAAAAVGAAAASSHNNGSVRKLATEDKQLLLEADEVDEDDTPII